MLEKRIELTNAHAHAQYKLPMDLLLFDSVAHSVESAGHWGVLNQKKWKKQLNEIDLSTHELSAIRSSFSANISAVCFEKRAKKIDHCKNSV